MLVRMRINQNFENFCSIAWEFRVKKILEEKMSIKKKSWFNGIEKFFILQANEKFNESKEGSIINIH